MLAQRLLEGEANVTISLIRYIVYKVRKNGNTSKTPQPLLHMFFLFLQKMRQKLKEILEQVLRVQ
jgi:hypothetical protein